ncbi:hypothetical protein PVK06_028986 [Gossypium arboreum]|uniref:Nodulin-like domain-containing protein n=1 Tax=Gossypium arboreum TaxID=29729 RepID=A0ABR0P5D0_GOSAR|nr:hypothetical protein PVK06_028986 [Gossypium arboreum]
MGSITMRGGLTTNELLPFTVHLIKGRWFALFASFLIMAGGVATYLFGIHSKEIKSTLNYEQTTLNLVGFYKDLGANVGVISGVVATVNSNLVFVLAGRCIQLCRLFHDMVSSGRKNNQAKDLANVHLHLHRSQFSEFCKHGSSCHQCQELP